MHIESSKQRNSSQPRSSSARPLAGHLTDVTLASEDGQLVTATRWSCLGRVPFSRTCLEIVTSSSFGLYERTDYGWMDKGEMIHTKRTWTRSSRDIEWNDWSTQTSGGSRKKSAYFCKTGFGTVAFLILTCSQTGVLTPSSSLSFQGSQFSWQ